VDSTINLPSVLFVLAAFFIAAAVTAHAWVKAAALARLLLLGALSGFLTALLATLVPALAGAAIILRIPTRRLVSGVTSTLFHSLLSLSIVCHIIPPLGVWYSPN
jgi:hypothetical protein